LDRPSSSHRASMKASMASALALIQRIVTCAKKPPRGAALSRG
jgi:ribosomal protein L17